MTSDDLVTWDAVADWLPKGIRAELLDAMGPVMRGWYTQEEAERDGGRFVEMRTASEAQPRLYRTGP